MSWWSRITSEKRGLLLLSVLGSGIALFPTLYATLISNSVSLLADFLRSLVDFIAILLAFLVTEKMRRLDISCFPFGFGKLEQLSSVVISFAMVCAAFVCCYAGVERLLNPEPLRDPFFGLVFGILSVFGNSFLWLRFRRVNQFSPSPIASSQAALFCAKMWASMVVVFSLITTLYGSGPAIFGDAIGSLALSLFLIYSAYQVAADSVGDLVDRAIGEGIQLTILKVLVRFEGRYRGFHALRTRRAGDEIHIQIELVFSPEDPVERVIDLSHTITSELELLLPTEKLRARVIPVKE